MSFLLISAKLLKILVPNTITAAKYIGSPNLSPKYTNATDKTAFPKNPDINISALNCLPRPALIAPNTESRQAKIATEMYGENLSGIGTFHTTPIIIPTNNPKTAITKSPHYLLTGLA